MRNYLQVNTVQNKLIKSIGKCESSKKIYRFQEFQQIRIRFQLLHSFFAMLIVSIWKHRFFQICQLYCVGSCTGISSDWEDDSLEQNLKSKTKFFKTKNFRGCFDKIYKIIFTIGQWDINHPDESESWFPRKLPFCPPPKNFVLGCEDI